MRLTRLMTVAVSFSLVACATDFTPTGDGEADTVTSDMETEADVAVDVPDDSVPDETSDPDVVDATDASDVLHDSDGGDVGPECGNGELEDGEECDDGADGDDTDGCTDGCLYSCHEDADCRDDDVCNGDETCAEPTDEGRVCHDGTPLEDGYVVGEDPRVICLDGASAESACGDGYVDTGAGEYCEPPDDGACDSECHWGCTSDDDCPDDGDICNGEEFCDTDAHVCDRREVPEDGTVCQEDPRRICLSGNCQDSTCGDRFTDADVEECDDGRDGDPDDGCTDSCLYSCHADSDCDDTEVCNGAETCGAVTADGRACQPGTDADPGTHCDDGLFCTDVDQCDGAGSCDGTGNPCDDGLACTENACDEASGCEYPILSSYCLIAGECYTNGDLNPANDCEECDPSSPMGWSPVMAGTGCADDGFFCTDDLCDDAGSCTHPVLDGNCLIDGTCHDSGNPNPSNECEECDPATDRLGWSPSSPGSPCTDEGLLCTDDECDGDGGCTHSLTAGNCLIGGDCVADGEENPLNECELCLSSSSTSGWSPKTAGAFCDDDGLVCTQDLCDSAGNCVHDEAESGFCYISDGCFVFGDRAAYNECMWCDPDVDQYNFVEASYGAECSDDAISCTVDQCNGGACEHVPATGWCFIDGSCYMGGTLNPSNSCQECDPGTSQTGWTNLNYGDPCADDGVDCTNDVCTASGTCTHPVVADECYIMGFCYIDGEDNPANECEECNPGLHPTDWSDVTYGAPCTADAYDCTMDICSMGSCQHPINDGSCLIDGACWVDDDLNPDNTCEFCNSPSDQRGWTVKPPGAMCDDGDYCTNPDQCTSTGACLGTTQTYLFGAVQVDAGYDNTCAVLDTGGVKCWGAGGYGQNGNGIYGGISAPDDVTGLSSGVEEVSVGSNHACARTDTGEVKCWGQNLYGQVGVDPMGDNYGTPQDVPVSDLVTDVCASGSHSCAVLSTGNVQCWGWNHWGQLGNGFSGTGQETPVPQYVLSTSGIGFLTGIDEVTCGSSHTCARRASTGEILCWGAGMDGRLGDDKATSSPLPVYVVNYSGTTTHLPDAYNLASAGGTTCVLTPGQYPKCWGWNASGQVGAGEPSPWPTGYDAPDWVVLGAGGPNSNNTDIGAGARHTCSVRNNNVYCWGHNEYGQLGDGLTGTANNRNTADPVLMDSGGTLLSGATDVTGGSQHTCAVVGAAGHVWCWGERSTGQLGDGLYSGATEPYPVQTHCK